VRADSKQILPSSDHRGEMLRPIGNCVVLESEISVPCEGKGFFLADILIEALEREILEAQGG
jgi:hypothetical protein